MWTRSAAFDLAVQYGGHVVQQAQVLRSGVSQALPATLRFLPGSSVQIDRRASIRRTLKAKIADPTGVWFPKSRTDLLAPYGNELAVQVGFQYVGGTTETVPVGVFAIEEVDTTTEGEITLSGRDRASVVEQQLFDAPYVIAPSQNLGTAIQALLNNRYPGTLTYNFATTTATTPVTPLVYQEGKTNGDPWKNAVDLAFANGYELFFAPDGSCVMQPMPSLSPNTPGFAAAWTYSPGAGALVLSEEDALTSKDVYNEIVVIGEGAAVGTTGGVRATAVVTDPASPILPGGPFGKRPFFLQDSSITTVGQAQATASALLLRYAGSGEVLSFSAAPHPAHDGSDVVRLTSAALSLDTYLIVDAFPLDLGLAKPAQYATTGARSS